MEIDAGIAPECYGTPNSAAPNMGPRYSSDGAVQAVVRAGAKKIAFDQSNVPGTGYIAAGPTAVAKSLNVPITQFKDNVPIQDANSIALKLVQAAGTDGGVVLNFTPPEALKILQAAQQQGLQDRVKAWGCSTPCNTDFVAKALGQQWDGKLLVNAELNVTDADGPAVAALPRGLREVRREGVRRPGLVQPDGLHDGPAARPGPAESSRATATRSRPSTRRSRTSRGSRPTSSAGPGTTARRRCTSRTTSTGPPRRRTARW